MTRRPALFSTLSALAFGLSACGGPAASGELPTYVGATYEAPSARDMRSAYLRAFKGRYDIEPLAYPEDIQLRMDAAQVTKMQRMLKSTKKRKRMATWIGLKAVSMEDVEKRQELQALVARMDSKSFAKDTAAVSRLMELMRERDKMSPSELAAARRNYDRLVKLHPRQVRTVKNVDCEWQPMKRLIGSGHEAMAVVHGWHPVEGYYCHARIFVERRAGYPRDFELRGYFVRDQEGEWDYYGKFQAVSFNPRRQQLDPAMLADPEKAILSRKSREDTLAAAFN